jgi:ABC-type multidrug transport system fused ATPase/permease subunit
MRSGEKRTYWTILFFRCAVALFDLVGVLAIGYLATSIALFVTSGSDPKRELTIAGFTFAAVNIKILPFAVGLILVLFVAKAIASIVLTGRMAVLVAKVEARAARRVAEAILGNDLFEARSLSKEQLYYAVSAGTSAAFSTSLNSLGTLVSEGFLFIILVSTFLFVDPISTLCVIVYFGLIAYFIQFFVGKRLENSSIKIAEKMVVSNVAVNDLAGAMRELTVAGRRNYYFDRIQSSRNSAAENIGRQIYLTGMPRYIIETALLLGIMAFGGVKMLSGDLAGSVTTLGVFLTGSMRLMAAMLPWQTALITLRQAMPMASISQKYLDREAEETDSQTEQKNQNRTDRDSKSVSFKKVSFTYPGSSSAAIKDVSFEIPKGAQVAIIGKSGSGKSTLADLMMGLLQPTSGAIAVGNQSPVDLINQQSGLLGYVPQSPGTLSGSIAQNIAIGIDWDQIDQARLAEAISQAHLDGLIASLPQGLKTDLGTYNDALSGGQLQRVGLARALYSQPSVLLMDEATSALDAESEHEISNALDELRGKVTLVLIAHRLHTVQNADIVFVVDDGQIIDQGKFTEVVSRNESVAKAVDLMSFN